MPVMEGTITISEGINQVTTILSGVADIITSNILYMIPVCVSLVAMGIGLFKRIKR